MKTTVTFDKFREYFKTIRPNNFSHEGLQLLFDHLEELEKSTGIEDEIDVTAIDSDYWEKSFDDFASSFEVETDRVAIESKLKKHSALVGFTSDDRVVYQKFQ